MYNGLCMTISHVSAVAALCALLITGTQAADYQPLPGSFRPPSIGGTSTRQSGFRQSDSQFITTPSQQQAWTSQPYGSSSNYYLPAPQPAPQYQQPNTSSDSWGRSIGINPGNVMNNMFGSGKDNSYNQPTMDYQPNVYQPPVYSQPYQYGGSYPQTYHYGSSYPQLYGYTAPQVQQPAVAPPSQPAQQPAPFPRRPFGGKESRFRPPELKGTD